MKTTTTKEKPPVRGQETILEQNLEAAQAAHSDPQALQNDSAIFRDDILRRTEPKSLADVAANAVLLEPPHDPKPTRLYTIEEIHLRAITVTPLLKEILNFRPPPHWGINE
jgi:hypothetical protein